jgi:hypothetical protein
MIKALLAQYLGSNNKKIRLSRFIKDGETP